MTAIREQLHPAVQRGLGSKQAIIRNTSTLLCARAPERAAEDALAVQIPWCRSPGGTPMAGEGIGSEGSQGSCDAACTARCGRLWG